MKLFKKFNKKGFTLFELLAVMAILAIIAGIAVPRVLATINNSRIDSIHSSMEMLANAARRMVIETQIGNANIDGADGTAEVIVLDALADQLDDTSDAAIGEALSAYIEELNTTAYAIYVEVDGSAITIFVEYKDNGLSGLDAAEVASAYSDVSTEGVADALFTGSTVGNAYLSITP